METTAVQKPATNAASLIPPMRVLVVGRIERKPRQHNGKHYTHVICPAADAYSRPQMVEIRSSTKLGTLGDEIKVSCVLGGYGRKPYDTLQDGEKITVYPIEHTLDAVE